SLNACLPLLPELITRVPMPSSVPYSPVARGSEAVAKQTALSIATTVPTAQCFIVTANGEVEGPRRSADQAPRAHTLFQRPRRQTTHASRPPPTIVSWTHQLWRQILVEVTIYRTARHRPR